VGKHPKKDQAWLLNGFGSHGIMIGPWASLALFNKIEHNLPILSEMDIERYERLYPN
jgi:glycine/D-amino acid oxidase-like deaminating enzyme